MVLPPLFLTVNGLGNIGVHNKHCRYTAAAIASDATQIRMEIICKTPNKTLNQPINHQTLGSGFRGSEVQGSEVQGSEVQGSAVQRFRV
jgi:hypothetical protein